MNSENVVPVEIAAGDSKDVKDEKITDEIVTPVDLPPMPAEAEKHELEAPIGEEEAPMETEEVPKNEDEASKNEKKSSSPAEESVKPTEDPSAPVDEPVALIEEPVNPIKESVVPMEEQVTLKEEPAVPTEATTEKDSSEGTEEDAKEETPEQEKADDTSKAAEEAPQPSREEQEARLTELVAAGRRSLKLNEIENATDALSDAAELSSKLYGDNNIKTFESLMYYGMACLELAKQEAQLLKSQEDDKIDEAEEDGEEEQKVEAEVKKVEEGEEAEEKKVEEEEEEREDGEETGSKNGEESDSMMLAWELLENARCIVTAHIELLESEKADEETIKTWKLQKADVLVLLGEHSMADGKFSQAQEDFLTALEIQNELLPASSRLIAQTNVLIGNACTLDARFEETIVYHNKAKSVLSAKIEELKNELKGAEGEKKAEIEAELKELEESAPGLDSMITEAVSAAAEAEEVKKQMKTQFERLTATLTSTEAKPEEVEVNDISNLVRRPMKRPPSEQSEASDAKKPKEMEETATEEKAQQE